MKYALVRDDGTIDRFSTSVDPSVQTKPGLRWLPCQAAAQPTFDPLTEALDGPSYIVAAKAVTESWTKRSLTAREISEQKDAKIGFSAFHLQTFLDVENRVRALEGKQALTSDQYRAALRAKV